MDPDRFERRIAAPCRWLAARPGVLFAVVWALDAIWFPYSRWAHDANLYAMQVMNRVSHGAFSDDLFLRFGSQDQYSPFSMLVAPLAQAVGLDWAFFLLFLVFNGLLVLGFLRLVQTLIADEVVSTLALVFLAMSPLPYAGEGLLHVQEPFFTARTIAVALSVFAIERFCHHRYRVGLMLAAIATVVHPLIGFGVLFVGIGGAAFDLLPRRSALGILALIGVAGFVLLGYPPVGITLFGTMSGTWLETVRVTSSLNFPELWMPGDWSNLVLSLIVPIWAAVLMRREAPHRFAVILLAVIVGVLGLTVMMVAARIPYRLILQAQPYRALWIVQLLEIPLLFWIGSRLWARPGASRVLACLLLGVLGLSELALRELFFPAIAISCMILVHNGPGSKTRVAEGLVQSLIGGFAIGFIMNAVIRLMVALNYGRELATVFDPMVDGYLLPVFYPLFLLQSVGQIVWLGLVVAGLGLAMRNRWRSRNIAVVSVMLAVACHSITMVIHHSTRYRAWMEPEGSDMRFARDYFKMRHSNESRPLTIYGGTFADVGFVWFELKAKNYFNLSQGAGSIFSEQTAIEVRRRSQVVSRFELRKYGPFVHRLSPGVKSMYVALFQPGPRVLPNADDLRRLCHEQEGVDVAILKDEFSNLAAATNGRVFIYECADVRARMGS